MLSSNQILYIKCTKRNQGMNYENALISNGKFVETGLMNLLFDYHYCFPPGAKIGSILVSYFIHMGLNISGSFDAKKHE